ncbi:MAG: transketolase [Candidatus Doudnabacteria bacterium]|nr:transketolase [Candidatus Doudnabacteria bacterium]
MDIDALQKLSKLVRYFILVSTTAAGSGHPTSSLSAVELAVTLLFGGFFRFEANNPEYPNNDRLIFSKGHAAPLFYSLWAAAGKVSEEELLTLRKFGSPLEGHPIMSFPFTEAATGSLGQGLSVGVGMAINAKHLDKLSYRTFVLLGDSEMAEGSVWEAIQLAAHYKLDNLVGILDVNRLGQSRETMYGHDLDAYKKRVEAFGWETTTIDGHNLGEISKAFDWATSLAPSGPPPLLPRGKAGARGGGKPRMIIAKTIKGKGVSFLEDKDGWHGKALSREDLDRALSELGSVDKNLRGEIAMPEKKQFPISNFQFPNKVQILNFNYEKGKTVATRKAYGDALARIGEAYPKLVVLDGEVSNSTFSEIFKAKFPERFFEMYIAEQNMVGTALGLSRRGKLPFVSTFSVFFTRAFDQIRMANYSGARIVFCGSHAGVSIGEDGVSQMGLEDLALFRSLLHSTVLYPCDAVSAQKLVELAAENTGITYLRTTRKDTPVIYGNDERFSVGGSKVLRSGENDLVTVVAAGVTVHEALGAYELLSNEGIAVRVIDLYTVKPLDLETLEKAAEETQAIITVEDHYAEGGLGEAVASSLAYSGAKVHIMAVRKLPKSGTPAELLDYEEICSDAIVGKVREVLTGGKSAV